MARNTRTAFKRLTSNPQNAHIVKVELRSTVDGGLYEFWDDGVNEEGNPGRFRQQLLAALDKERDGMQVFKADKALKPRFAGDRLPRLAGVIGKDGIAHIEAEKPKRKARAKHAEQMLEAKKAEAKSAGDKVSA